MTVFSAGFVETPDVDVKQLWQRLVARTDGVTVVIPVHDAAREVEACIESVLRFSGPQVEVLVVDDASKEPETIRLLDTYAASGAIRLERLPSNRGFTKTANHGMRAAGRNDVILLNSDTEVGPLWWQRLRWVAYSQPSVATVSAVSNNAGHVSVPDVDHENDWPAHTPWSAISRLFIHEMYVWSQEWPAAAGFCLYVRREALDALTGFDEEAFPRGYGEEVDFAQRAINASLVNLIAPHVMVRHQKHSSYGSKRRNQLLRQTRPILRARYPRRHHDIEDWRTSPGNHLFRTIARRLLKLSEGELASGVRVAAIAPREVADAGSSSCDVWLRDAGGARLGEFVRAGGQGAPALGVALTELAVVHGIEGVELADGLPTPLAAEALQAARALALSATARGALVL